MADKQAGICSACGHPYSAHRPFNDTEICGEWARSQPRVVSEAAVRAAKRKLFHESEDCDDEIRAALEAAYAVEEQQK